MLKLSKFSLPRFLNSSHLCLSFFQCHGTSIGFFMKNGELTLCNSNSGLFLINLLVPWLQRLLLGCDLVRECLCFAFEALSNADELLLFCLHPFLHRGNLPC